MRKTGASAESHANREFFCCCLKWRRPPHAHVLVLKFETCASTLCPFAFSAASAALVGPRYCSQAKSVLQRLSHLVSFPVAVLSCRKMSSRLLDFTTYNSGCADSLLADGSVAWLPDHNRISAKTTSGMSHAHYAPLVAVCEKRKESVYLAVVQLLVTSDFSRLSPFLKLVKTQLVIILYI